MELSNGDMVDAADAKLSVQTLSFEAVQVLDHIWPKMDDVVAGKLCSFLNANDCEKKNKLVIFLKTTLLTTHL